MAGCSPKLDRTAQNPKFFVSGGQVFLSSFSGSFDESLSRRLVSGYQELRTAQRSARVSRSLQPRGRWARSGKNVSRCQIYASAVGVAPRDGAASSGASRFEREQFACEAVLSGLLWVVDGSFLEASSLLALVALLRVLVQFLLVLSTLPSENILLGVLAVMVRRSVLREDGRALRPLPEALRQVRKFHRRVSENLSSFIFFDSACTIVLSPSSLVSQNSSLSHGLGAMNSCGFMHGVDMHDNSFVVHENSCSALEHKNSCSSHAAGVQEGTKAPSMSTRLGVRRSAVEKLASPQLTSPKLHVEPFAGLLRNQGLRFSQEEEIVPGCAVSVACPSCLDHSPEPPGPGRIIRNMLGWSQLENS